MKTNRYPERALAALFLMLPLLAGAQVYTHGREVQPGTTLHQYIASQEHIRDLAAAGNAWDARLKRQAGCTSQRFVSLKALMIYEPITMVPGSPYPAKGVWQERFSLERCGESTTYNVLFSAVPETKPRSAHLYPGESNATARLFLDASMVAHVVLASALPKQADGKHCGAVEILDTRVVKAGYETTLAGRGVVGGLWDEAWTYRGCGAEARLLGTFVPDGRGGTSFSFKLAP